MNTLQTILPAILTAVILSACTVENLGHVYPLDQMTKSTATVKKNTTVERIIYSIEGDEISFSDMIEKLAQADYILLGEQHDDPVHHRLQQRVLAALIKSGRQPAVVFEMFDREDAGLIASVSRQHPDDPDQIAKAVNWKASGWPDWQMYRPIVKTAMDASLPVIAGNLSRWRARRMIIEGVPLMNSKTATHMGLLTPLPSDQEEQLRQKISLMHGMMAPTKVIAGMLAAQRVRDATLADSMISRNYGNGAVLIAGREHTRTDYGVPFYLNHREPEAKIASLAFIDASEAIESEQSTDSKQAEHAYDFVWMLPSTYATKYLESPKIAHQQKALDY